MKSNMKSKLTYLGTSLMMSCLASQVFASGFAIQEQNVTNLGLAYSGTAALAEDASTGHYNAAGLTRLGESEIVLSGVLIQGDFDFTASSTNVSFGIADLAVPGATTDDPGTVNLVPAFHISKRLDGRWVFGFNVTAPFGLDSEYHENGVARYSATFSSLRTMNFSPSLAYEVLPCLSIGAGPDAEFGKADLELRTGTGNASLDGFQKNHAQGWGYGWHAGVLWSPWNTTRIGLHYRSHVNFYAEGTSENQVPINAIFGGAAGAYSLQRVTTHVTLPETATASLYHAFNNRLALTADAAWTNWSRFHTLRLRFNPGSALVVGGAQSPGIDTDTWEHFRDARRFALGLIYTHNDAWLFRIGTAFDQTPTSDEFRTARIPDEDRIWAAIGGAYTFSKALRIDFGYAHLFFEDATINEAAPFRANTQTPITMARLAGSYDSNANLVGIQMRYDFV